MATAIPRPKTLLDAHALPSIGDVANILEAHSTLMGTVRSADDVVIRWAGHDTDTAVHGWGSETRAEVIAISVEWTWESRTQGPRRQGATIIQVDLGGRSGGEGWAETLQYVTPTVLTTNEVVVIARLAVAESLPLLVAAGEL